MCLMICPWQDAIILKTEGSKNRKTLQCFLQLEKNKLIVMLITNND